MELSYRRSVSITLVRGRPPSRCDIDFEAEFKIDIRGRMGNREVT
jgi:hypothetical protein